MVIRLEDYFQMVIISISPARTTQFADVNAVGHVVGMGEVVNLYRQKDGRGTDETNTEKYLL